ncbi:catalase A [Elasticomyces elasticus]|nr:catalase A [Elasticomyces elasticus]
MPIVLQARMFSYPDAARYRVGPNYQQLKSNRPISRVYNPYVRDGPSSINGNYGGDPDYVRSELRPISISRRHQMPTHEKWSGEVAAFATELTERDFVQPRELWHIICKERNGRRQFLENIVSTMIKITPVLRMKVSALFGGVEKELEAAIMQGVKNMEAGVPLT